MSLGWGAMGAGAWGGKPKEPAPGAGADSSDEELGGSPAPGALPAGSAPAKPVGNKALATPPPSAYPSAGMFAAGQTNDAYEGPMPSSSRHQDLDARERDLIEREAKLKKLEEQIKKDGGYRPNNWPVCFPIWHHDIQGEIPDEAKRVVREVYMSWWGLMLCLSFQVFCATVMMGYKPDNHAIPSWFLSLIYWVAGLAGSLWLWYKRLYHAARHGTTAGYVVFFLFYFVHICWCIWCAIAIPVEAASWSFSGFATAIAAIDVHPFPGVIYFIGAALWCLEATWCLWCIKDTYLFFRGRGGIEQAKQDAAIEAFKHQQQTGHQQNVYNL
uniref:Secretory carrier-associated membrane protein n=1 Tax=Dunaliella tertiolecta TaxID=3047 RepID=A0A7S3VSH0_DUNTE|mmetsp:Transcript_18445/g.51739  ORF Transcript_18445/g.51739 Transcript_18445/m.51739 type:complete len:328 (-) Transcript_18445:1304-2287(-)|eukprot:CAMPEP_0202352612 /NCGR_PEP_ID=MMETSP1126-20121109/8729_1 /ASSEMBLY_ACC=CAM_ASM_000457 /TAXON_ID=3047 /ORGANISM="Dunaliella tertiolecta, Strain CCMP1320" /LENGTH=327 /DNA_ID=CAMNT_0048944847 /DNA_START=137 /DNA_END=1120 /DNA_ORIENTATION=+